MISHQAKRVELKGFTLLEVLIALSVTAISLVPLLHLLVTSISAMDSASLLSRASLIGNAKLAEVISRGYPEPGTESGIIDNKDNNVSFKWQVDITDTQADEFKELKLNGLRKVSVTVQWDEGRRLKEIHMSTYISKEQDIKETVLKNNNS
ncbi:MAG: prepilin-type N-terminal cleavage/methylation domain-containing protein [Sedimentisphaerales bacterium]|nr:prepilin-type N-terminal cleavage/methylation domain-containing protein [Sedimentisphaerales bacterium]